MTETNLGWHVTYLGASLPAAEIAGSGRKKRTRAVALSLVLSRRWFTAGVGIETPAWVPPARSRDPRRWTSHASLPRCIEKNWCYPGEWPHGPVRETRKLAQTQEKIETL